MIGPARFPSVRDAKQEEGEPREEARLGRKKRGKLSLPWLDVMPRLDELSQNSGIYAKIN